MKGRRVWEIGGFIAGASADRVRSRRPRTWGSTATGRSRTSSTRSTSSAARTWRRTRSRRRPRRPGFRRPIELPTCDVVDEEIDTGREARCFAQYMRIHALEATGGLTYAQMGRFQSAANPDDPAGTSDEAAAAKDESGQPYLERRPEPLDHRDRARDRVERLLHGRADLDLRHRRRSRADPDGHRARHPRVRGLRPRAGGDRTAFDSLSRGQRPPGREAPILKRRAAFGPPFAGARDRRSAQEVAKLGRVMRKDPRNARATPRPTRTV